MSKPTYPDWFYCEGGCFDHLLDHPAIDPDLLAEDFDLDADCFGECLQVDLHPERDDDGGGSHVEVRHEEDVPWVCLMVSNSEADGEITEVGVAALNLDEAKLLRMALDAAIGRMESIEDAE